AVSDAEASTAKIDDLASRIKKDSEELEAAKGIREAEKAEFEESEAELMSASDTLSRAIRVLEREMAKHPAAFAQAAATARVSGLASALGAVLDSASLLAEDKARLLQLAQSSQEEDADDAAGAPAPGAYESHSGGIVDTLEELREKAEAKLKASRQAEASNAHVHGQLLQGLQGQIAADQKALAELVRLRRALENSRAALAAVQEGCMRTASDHELSTKSREKELKVIAEACATEQISARRPCSCACTEATAHFCVPAGAFHEGFAVGSTERPACDEHGDVVPEEILTVEYASVQMDRVSSFGEALNAQLFPFGLEGLWPATAALFQCPKSSESRPTISSPRPLGMADPMAPCRSPARFPRGDVLGQIEVREQMAGLAGALERIESAMAGTARAHGRGHAARTGAAPAQRAVCCQVPTAALAEALQAITDQSRATAALLAQGSAAAADQMCALLGGGDGAGGGPGTKLPGAKGAAALKVWRRHLEANPASMVVTVCCNARRVLAASDGDTDLGVNSMREYLSRQVAFGQAKGVAYLAYGIATVADFSRSASGRERRTGPWQSDDDKGGAPKGKDRGPYSPGLGPFGGIGYRYLHCAGGLDFLHQPTARPLRWRARRANVLVCALSQLAARGRRVAPAAARSGRPLTDSQKEICDQLLGLARLIHRLLFTLGGRETAKLNSTCDYAAMVQAAVLRSTCAPPAARNGEDFTSERAEFLAATYSFVQVGTREAPSPTPAPTRPTRRAALQAERGRGVVRFLRELAKEQHSAALAQLAGRVGAVAQFGASAAAVADPFGKIRGHFFQTDYSGNSLRRRSVAWFDSHWQQRRRGQRRA
ncbi:unnamed protein product, partial [Prorocentrum cordatum]